MNLELESRSVAISLGRCPTVCIKMWRLQTRTMCVYLSVFFFFSLFRSCPVYLLTIMGCEVPGDWLSYSGLFLLFLSPSYRSTGSCVEAFFFLELFLRKEQRDEPNTFSMRTPVMCSTDNNKVAIRGFSDRQRPLHCKRTTRPARLISTHPSLLFTVCGTRPLKLSSTSTRWLQFHSCTGIPVLSFLNREPEYLTVLLAC